MKIKIESTPTHLRAPMPKEGNGITWDDSHLSSAALRHFKTDLGLRDGTSDVRKCGNATQQTWEIFAQLHGWDVEYV